MLFPRLNRQHEASGSLGVNSLTDDAPRRAAQPFVPCRQKADIGAAKRQGQTQRLPFPHDDVGAENARSFEHPKRYGVHGRNEQRSLGLRGPNHFPQVFDAAKEIWVLANDSRRFFIDHFGDCS